MKLQIYRKSIQKLLGITTSIFILQAVPADALEITGDMGIFSQYVFRGLTQTNGRPALQGDLTLATDTGLSGTVWFSNTELPSAPQFGGRKVVEFDWILDYSGSVNNVNYSFGHAFYSYLYDGNSNFSEAYAALSLNTLLSPSLSVYYMDTSPKGVANFIKGDTWFDLGVSTDMGEFSSALTLSYARYKKDASRTANDYNNGFTTALLQLSRDISINKITLSPSFSLYIPLAKRNNAGIKTIYGLPAKSEFTAGLNINY